MKVRVNVNTEYEAQSYLVETDHIRTPEVRKAIEFAVDNPSGTKRFSDFIQVVNGEILQDGYAMNEDLRNAAIGEDAPNVSVQTTV